MCLVDARPRPEKTCCQVSKHVAVFTNMTRRVVYKPNWPDEVKELRWPLNTVNVGARRGRYEGPNAVVGATYQGKPISADDAVKFFQNVFNTSDSLIVKCKNGLAHSETCEINSETNRLRCCCRESELRKGARCISFE